MIKQLSIAFFSVALAAGAGCATHERTGQLVGGAAGAAAGAQIGGGTGQTAAMIGGTVLGAMIGGELGARMDRRDEQRTVQAFETGQPTTWTNPDTGYRYEVQPQQEYQAEVGTCRDYTMNAVIDGQTEVVTGTACRQPDGTWEIIG